MTFDLETAFHALQEGNTQGAHSNTDIIADGSEKAQGSRSWLPNDQRWQWLTALPVAGRGQIAEGG